MKGGKLLFPTRKDLKNDRDKEEKEECALEQDEEPPL